MKFRLTYEGPLHSSRGNGIRGGNAAEKHRIRRLFHPQLRAYWQVNEGLKDILEDQDPNQNAFTAQTIIRRHAAFGFQFLPLVSDYAKLQCELDILVLRSGVGGPVSGDIDNRLKTLFDAPQKPQHLQELVGATPQVDEDPFYVLLSDDSLITRISLETDTMLAPVGGDPADVRLVITVTVSGSGPMTIAQMGFLH